MHLVVNKACIIHPIPIIMENQFSVLLNQVCRWGSRMIPVHIEDVVTH